MGFSLNKLGSNYGAFGTGASKSSTPTTTPTSGGGGGDLVTSTNAMIKTVDTGYGNAMGYLQPYQDTGLKGLSMLEGLLTNPSSITSDPGYQFGFDEGSRALNQKYSSTGKLFSGEADKELIKFGQDYAGTKLDESYNRYLGTANMGLSAAGGMGQLEAGRVSEQTGLFDSLLSYSTGQQQLEQQEKDREMGLFGDALSAGGSFAGMYLCWVAVELYGENSIKTRIIRAYCISHLKDKSIMGAFCRMYLNFGKTWAKWIKRSSIAKQLAKKIWDALYAKAISTEDK